MEKKHNADALLPEGVNMQQYIQQVAEAKALGTEMAPVPLDQLITGADFEHNRKELRETGVTTFRSQSGAPHVFAAEVNEQGHVMAVAAAIPRTPSKAEDFLKEIADFKTQANQTRSLQIQLLRRIYIAEGIVNNAINKVTALIATNGSYKVRRVKGVRGKGGDKRAEEFRTLLQFFVENVNSSSLDGVVTGGRGLKSFITQGVRTCLIEGDHFARTNWSKVAVPSLGGQKFSLPINIQTFGGETIVIPDQAAALGLEFMYWKPPATVVQAIQNPSDPELGKLVQKLIPSEVQSAIKKDGQYLLDSSLMAHIKHRGQMFQAYGESFIQAAFGSIAYKRSLQALEIVTIENLINRLLILKVGSDNEKSAYHKAEVSAKRVTMLQNMMKKVGPASTIIWAGPDISAEDVGAAGKMWEMDGRFQLANSQIRADLGTPSALLTGEGSDGKASALAAIIAVAAQIQEVQEQYTQTLRTWAERIAVENGYDDVDVTWEFSPNPLINKTETLAQLIQGYQMGVVPVRIIVEEGFGGDFEAWETLMSEEVAKGYRQTMFGAPEAILEASKAPPTVSPQHPLSPANPNTDANGNAIQPPDGTQPSDTKGGGGGNGSGSTTNPSGKGNGGGGAGRPTNSQRPGKPDPRSNKEVPKPTT